MDMKNQPNTNNTEIPKKAQEKQQKCFFKAQINFFNQRFEDKFLSLCLGKNLCKYNNPRSKIYHSKNEERPLNKSNSKKEKKRRV